MDKQTRSDLFWREKFQRYQPMSEWYKVHEPNRPHIAAIWQMIEVASQTNGRLPSELEIATQQHASFDAVRRILKNVVLAGGTVKRDGNNGLSVALPDRREHQETRDEPDVTLRDIYDKLSELVELTRSVWGSNPSNESIGDQSHV